MQLNPAEISELIKSRIEGLAASADVRNQGTVISVTDGIVRIHGLSDAMAGEMLEFKPTPDGTPTFGLADADPQRATMSYAASSRPSRSARFRARRRRWRRSSCPYRRLALLAVRWARAR